MTVEVFMILLSAISIATGLCVEAIKKMYSTNVYNTIAAVVSLVLSVGAAIGYAVVNENKIDAKYIVFMICLALGSWLSSQLGFDKVKQAIKQFGEA